MMDKVETYRGYTIVIEHDEDVNSPRENDNQATMICFHSRYNLGDYEEAKQYNNDPEQFWKSLSGIDEDEMEEDENSESGETLYLYEGRYYPIEGIRGLREAKIDAEYAYSYMGLLDHSGLHIYLGGGAHWSDGAGWDSGTIGVIYIAKKKVLDEYGHETWDEKAQATADRIFKQEVEDYDDYLTGNAWGYIIKEGVSQYVDDGGLDLAEDLEEMPEVDSGWGFIGDIDYCLKEGQSIIDATIRIKHEVEQMERGLPKRIRRNWGRRLRKMPMFLRSRDRLNYWGKEALRQILED